VSFVKNVDWKKVVIGATALAVSAVVVTATGGLAAGAVVSALNLACGTLGASIASGIVVGAIGGSTYNLVNSALSGNDAKTVFQDTLMGGFTGGIFGGFTGGVGFGLGQATNLGEFGKTVLGGVITGGGVRGLTSSIAAGDDAKTTAWNTLKGIAGGATIGGTAAAIGYGAAKARSKLLGTGVKACFIAGTVVLTAEGLKKIEDIRAGDRVYAKDVEGGKQEMKEVLQTFEREVDVLVHLWIGGEEIVTTQTHPFYVEGKGWTEARELTEEDRVLDSKNEKLRVEGIRIEELREPVKVYNFEVEEYHTYYVGDAEVLVHNDNCGRGSGNAGEGGGNIAKNLDTNNISKMTKQEIADAIPDNWKYTEHNNFVHIKDEVGKMRIRIDPPDKVTQYPHVHIYDNNGNLLDKTGNVVDRKSPDGHIPYKN